MSGGVAYVLDEHQLFDTLCNLDMVDLESIWQEEDQRRAARPDRAALPLDRQPAGRAHPGQLAGDGRASSSRSCRSTTARRWSGCASGEQRRRRRRRRPPRRCSVANPTGFIEYRRASRSATGPSTSGSRTGTRSTCRWSSDDAQPSRPRAAWTAASRSATRPAAR